MSGTLRDYVGYGTLGARPVSPGITAVAGGSARYYATDTTTEYAWDGSAWHAVGGGSGMYSAYLLYQDQKTSGTQGGTFTSGSFQTRNLTTEVADTANHGALSSNQVTLDAGTYLVRAYAPAHFVDSHQLRLQNITAATTLVTGTSAWASSASGNAQSSALLMGRFTLSVQSVLELQHRCSTTRTPDGFGISAGFGTEIYASVEFWKEI